MSKKKIITETPKLAHSDRQAAQIEGVNTKAKPSGPGCKECLETGGWWMHLNRCAECGHVGCCDNSPNRHSRQHFHETKHPIIQRFEPGEDWFYDWRTDQMRDDLASVKLAAPTHHPLNQPVPGGKLPGE